MNSETLNNALGHLSEQFKRGQPILLTGAGFSSAAKNIIGTNVPLGYELKLLLWKLAFGDLPYEESSTLQDLFQTARTRHGRDLVQLLTENFTVNPDSLPEWYRTFFSFPWLRCYTLNIDNLETALQRRFKFPRRLASISATAMGPVSRDRASGTLEVIHLNGTLSDLPETAFLFRTQKSRKEKSDIREALAAAVQPMIDSYRNRPFQWINIFSNRDWISGSLSYYDDPSATQLVVDNRADPDARVPLAAHTQYWNNEMLADALYSVL